MYSYVLVYISFHLPVKSTLETILQLFPISDIHYLGWERPPATHGCLTSLFFFSFSLSLPSFLPFAIRSYSKLLCPSLFHLFLFFLFFFSPPVLILVSFFEKRPHSLYSQSQLVTHYVALASLKLMEILLYQPLEIIFMSHHTW